MISAYTGYINDTLYIGHGKEEFLMIILGYFVLFLFKKNISCGYSLEVLLRYPQHTFFMEGLEKIIPELSPNILPY